MTDTRIPPPDLSTMTPEQQQKAQEMILTNFIWPVLANAVNGLRLSLPQVPIPHLFVTACGLFGRLIGMTISQGSLTDVLKIRAACITAFGEGVRGVKPTPGPIPPGANDIKQTLNS